MTVEGDDDPEIILGAEPSAPPQLAATASIPVASALHAPVPVPVATPLGPPVPLAVAAQSSEASHGNSTIETTANPDDGSLSVKVTTTNTLPNGSGEITTEYFQIPAHMASSVSAGIDVGEPPSGLYLTRKEQRTLPAGTSQSLSSASPHPTTAYPVAGNALPLQRPNNQHNDRPQGRTEAATDEEKAQGTGAGHEQVAALPFYKRKGFVYAMIAVTLVAVGVAVLAVVLPSNNKGRPDQFTTQSELETAIREYLGQGCPTDLNCQARSVYGGAVSLCDVLPWSVYHIWSSNIPFCDSDG